MPTTYSDKLDVVTTILEANDTVTPASVIIVQMAIFEQLQRIASALKAIAKTDSVGEPSP